MTDSHVSLPANHPVVDAHEHKGLKCPVTGNTHSFCPPQPGDSRSVCPAINTMANHGYIPRDGKKISFFRLVRGLQQCYNLSTPLAIFLASGGFVLCHRVRPFDNLTQIGKHGGVEHDASLVHRDTPKGEIFAPTEIVESLVPEIVGDIRPKVNEDVTEDVLMDEEDVARSRVRREKDSPPLDATHAELARGEMAIILGVWEKRPQKSKASAVGPDGDAKGGAPLTYILEWLGHERLPEGWKPTHVQGLLDVMRRSKIMRLTMKKLRENEEAEKVKEKDE